MIYTACCFRTCICIALSSISSLALRSGIPPGHCAAGLLPCRTMRQSRPEIKRKLLYFLKARSRFTSGAGSFRYPLFRKNSSQNRFHFCSYSSWERSVSSMGVNTPRFLASSANSKAPRFPLSKSPSPWKSLSAPPGTAGCGRHRRDTSPHNEPGGS